MSLIKKIITNGLWHHNPALVQMLGLCPLLAVSTTAINALVLGIATTLVLILTNMTISLLRGFIPSAIRIPIYVIIIATVVTIVQLLLQAYALSLYQSLGIFIPLIITNCIVLGRAEAFAAKNKPLLALLDGLAMGIGMSMVLLLLGGCREVLGHGTLFQGAEMIFGSWGEKLTITWRFEQPFLLAILPPGAFILLGLLLAAKQFFEQQFKQPLDHPLKKINGALFNGKIIPSHNINSEE